MRGFHQSLADSVGDAAMNLALDDHRIDELAEVVDGGPAVDRDDAGLRIDLEFADMDAGRKGEVRRVPEGGLLQARLQFLTIELVRGIGVQRDRDEVDRFVRALDRELAVLELDVLVRSLQNMALASILSSAFEIADMPTAPEREP